jgi:arsenate reductase-like glutaredoxin family protein
LEANHIEIKETVPANRKLQASDCADVVGSAKKLIAMKGKKVEEFDLKAGLSDEAIAAMLGPTGNLRAPTIITGQTVLVGFSEEVFGAHF